jgi:hypothetical protein
VVLDRIENRDSQIVWGGFRARRSETISQFLHDNDFCLTALARRAVGTHIGTFEFRQFSIYEDVHPLSGGLTATIAIHVH